MCENAGCITTSALLLHEAVQSGGWSDVLESCDARSDDAKAANLANTVVVFDIGGALTRASFVTFLDWKQRSNVQVSWQAYTNISFSGLKFSDEQERSVISNNFIICPERVDACQASTHLRMRLADALWTSINMASRL